MKIEKRWRWMEAALKECRARAKLVVQDYSHYGGTSVEMVAEAHAILDSLEHIKLRNPS